MSIVFINNCQETFTPTQSGALATIIWECCRVAERRGASPFVVTRGCDADPFKWPQATFVQHPRVPTGKLGVLLGRADRKLTGWRHIRQREYASRVVRAIRAKGLQSLPLLLMNDPELTVVLRDAFPNARIVHWFQNQQECKPKFRALFAGAVNSVAGCSHFISRWIEGYYNLAPKSVQTIYNGVDSKAFFPAPIKPAGVPIINFVGRTGSEKAPDLLLKAALLMVEQTTQFAIQLIGSNHWDRFEMDDYQRQLTQLAEAVKAKGIRVRRPGHIGRYDLPVELQKVHIHVVPSRWDEPSALTIYEGMACGLPIVASRTGGTPEIVGDAGFLFERDSAAGLSRHLLDLVKDADLRRDFAQKARDRAAEFTWQRVWASLNDLAHGQNLGVPSSLENVRNSPLLSV